ncbi:asterix-like protein [Perilla frutescens var. frutescens]|nr:asterix-like protein [Perilla frutescens var. frutescens]
MASQNNDPRLPSAARPYKPPIISQQDLPVDYSGFIAVVFGVFGAMFRYKVCSWLAIIFCAQSLANMRNMENDLKQISMAMMFGIMGLVTNYLGLGPRPNPKTGWRNIGQMRGVLRATWLHFCKLLRCSPPAHTSLRDKAIAVAGRVTTVKDRESSKVSCPVCLDVIRTSDSADIRMTLAVHLSLWHPDDVMLQWDIMERKNESIVHLPSIIIGVGVAAGFGALVAISAKNRTQKVRR